jgi:hypothetical protein
VLGLVVVGGFVGSDQLVVEDVISKTNVEAEHRPSVKVQRFDLLDAIVYLSSGPVSACEASRKAAAEKNHRSTDESDQHNGKCAVVARPVGTALHITDHNTSIFSRCKLLRHVDRPSLRSFYCCMVGSESDPQCDCDHSQGCGTEDPKNASAKQDCAKLRDLPFGSMSALGSLRAINSGACGDNFCRRDGSMARTAFSAAC